MMNADQMRTSINETIAELSLWPGAEVYTREFARLPMDAAGSGPAFALHKDRHTTMGRFSQERRLMMENFAPRQLLGVDLPLTMGSCALVLSADPGESRLIMPSDEASIIARKTAVDLVRAGLTVLPPTSDFTRRIQGTLGIVAELAGKSDCDLPDEFEAARLLVVGDIDDVIDETGQVGNHSRTIRLESIGNNEFIELGVEQRLQETAPKVSAKFRQGSRWLVYEGVLGGEADQAKLGEYQSVRLPEEPHSADIIAQVIDDMDGYASETEMLIETFRRGGFAPPALLCENRLSDAPDAAKLLHSALSGLRELPKSWMQVSTTPWE